MRKPLIFASLALAAVLAVAGVAFAANEYTSRASTSPATKGSVKNPAPIGLKLGFNVRDTAGQRPKSMERLNILLTGIGTNGALFPKCSASQIERASSDSSCPSGSLVGSGFARNIAGNRTDFSDTSIRCYLSLRLHNAGAGRLALFVKGDPNAPGDRNCPVTLATAIPISISRSAVGSTFRLTIPESLKHPIQTLTNSIVEMSLNVSRKTKTVRGRKVGLIDARGRCRSGRRNITYTWFNEANDTATQTARARC